MLQAWGDYKGAQGNDSLPEEGKSGKIEAVSSGGGRGGYSSSVESSHLILGAFEGDSL